jgi:ATP-binding cassette subfamily B protein
MIASLLRLREFLAPYTGTLSLGVLAFFVARIFEALAPWFLAIGIDRLAAGRYDVWLPALGIATAVALRFGVVSYARMTVRKVGQYIAFDLRERLYRQLQLQGARFFNRYTIGDMMTRAISDIGLVQRLIAMGTILVIVFAFATVVGFSFMLLMSPKLTLLILPPLPFVFLYTYYASRQMGIASRDVQDRLSDLGTHVQENLSGIRTIQAMVQEENETRRFAATNQAYADAFYEQARINSAMAAWMPSLTALSSLVILGFGGSMVLDGELSVGTFTAFFMYLGMVVQPFRVAGFIVNLFQRAAVASDRLFEIFDLAPEIPDVPSGHAPRVVRGEIDVRALTYRYEGAAHDALAGIDLHIAPGETLAIMGRVGAGKTTLLKLLVRLLDSPRGTVRIDGHDVHDYPLSQLRSQLAMVPQDPFLFGEPIGANLTYDDPERAVDAILRAAESADFHTTIDELPERLGTIVGERGVTLSGGQKQRATLARGLIRNAPVLILDDCFSAVDTETEEHILSELKRLRAGQTTILVSHRVSTARHADRVVVLEEGRIVEEGSHPNLLARGGYYAELERIQREGATEADYATEATA